MSAEALSYVIRHSPYSGNAFAIHMLIGDIANDQHDFHFFMTNEELSKKARCSRQTVNTTVAMMVDDGFLEVVDKSTRYAAVKYAFIFKDSPEVYVPRRERQVSNSSRSGVKNNDTEVSLFQPSGVKNNDTELNKNSRVELNKNSSVEKQPLFDETDNPSIDPIQQVWDAYILTIDRFNTETGNTYRPRFTQQRRALIQKRLKDYSVEEIILAVTGWELNPFNRGDNPQRKAYNGLKTFLGSDDKVDLYISYHTKFPKLESEKSISEKWGREETQISGGIVLSNTDWDD